MKRRTVLNEKGGKNNDTQKKGEHSGDRTLNRRCLSNESHLFTTQFLTRLTSDWHVSIRTHKHEGSEQLF